VLGMVMSPVSFLVIAFVDLKFRTSKLGGKKRARWLYRPTVMTEN
jgi:hypothetical protein